MKNTRTQPIRMMCHRLADKDIDPVIKAFKRDTPKHKLAKQYGISLTSVKRVLRERGVRGKQHGREC